ncbi:hypothetical protein [Thalassovita taeanensis]|uniref:Uncharacterized protein n=1 Tax=Thalassovita taeanensis TaxID=657014 RepID=A0A1H9JCT2_9RHOB|nr:hypothetical protein [Thalassovita taeanensis]SEQ84660.1 hypothetical protein SAMN04488092_114107 [Thalassovita taeanensis]
MLQPAMKPPLDPSQALARHMRLFELIRQQNLGTIREGTGRDMPLPVATADLLARSAVQSLRPVAGLAAAGRAIL